MKKVSKISIVTPCFNAESYIAETIESVIGQKAVLNGTVALEYIVCDGKSTDKTVEIAESVLQAAPAACQYQIISEPDRGMYDALAKGLKRVSGDAIAYINAGDLYHSGAFGVVCEIFTAQLASWMTGYTVCYNERSQIVEATLPYRYRRNLFECGAYGNGLPHVQQESTFWRPQLLEQIDFETLARFKYAGDFYLWRQFARVADLKVVRSHLGGFKYHAGQLSQETVGDESAYQKELNAIVRKPTLGERMITKADRLLWSMPYKVKKGIAGDSFISYGHSHNSWQTDGNSE